MITAREIKTVEGFVLDGTPKSVKITAGPQAPELTFWNTLIEWKNIPITAQIQIVKKSADYNSTNGLPAGTLLEGAVFEIYDKAGNLVDTIKSDKAGVPGGEDYFVMGNKYGRVLFLKEYASYIKDSMISELTGLARINAEGKDAIRAAVVKLEKAGYVQRRQTTDKAGKFGANEYIIREYPASHEPPPEGPSSASPLSGNPMTAEPATDSTQTEKTSQINKDLQTKENKILTSQSTER